MLHLLFPLPEVHFPHLCLTPLIFEITSQVVFLFLANLYRFKCGLTIYLMSSHDEQHGVSLKYLITACFCLCIPHWTTGPQRAEAMSPTYVISPKSVLGTYWVFSGTHRIVLDWTQKHKNHSWKSLTLPFHPCTPVFCTCTHKLHLPIHTHMHTLAPSLAQN